MTNIWNYCGWDLEVVGRSFFFFFFFLFFSINWSFFGGWLMGYAALSSSLPANDIEFGWLVKFQFFASSTIRQFSCATKILCLNFYTKWILLSHHLCSVIMFPSLSVTSSLWHWAIKYFPFISNYHLVEIRGLGSPVWNVHFSCLQIDWFNHGRDFCN